MTNRYRTTNPLDRIFLGITNLVIVFAGAVVLYHCVVTSLDPPRYEALLPRLPIAASIATGID